MNRFLRRLRFMVSNEAAARNEGGGFGSECREIDSMSTVVLLWFWACNHITARPEHLCPRGAKFPFPELLAGGTRRRNEQRRRERAVGLTRARSAHERSGRAGLALAGLIPLAACLKAKQKKPLFKQN